MPMFRFYFWPFLKQFEGKKIKRKKKFSMRQRCNAS